MAAASEDAIPTRIILNLTATPATSQGICWRTGASTGHAVVQLALSGDGPNFMDGARTIPATTESLQIAPHIIVCQHSAVLTELMPDTLYAYRVGDGTTFSEWNQFRTAASGSQPFSFVYLGDPQTHILSLCSRVFRTTYEHAPQARFWLIAGDLVNKGDIDSLWGELFDALGWIPRTTPIVAVVGNHGYWTGSGMTMRGDILTPLWRPQFTQPENGPKELAETCFTLVYQDTRFIILNGNERLQEQATWMEKILATNTCGWTIVCMHQPCYPGIEKRDIPELRKLFVPLYDQYGVDLVLQGHDHTYARTYPLRGGKRVGKNGHGTVYVISVSGPKMYEPATKVNPLMARTGSNTELYQVIHIQQNSLIYESFTVTGKLFDRFELLKKTRQAKGAVQ